jgi:hypothetical protein
VLGKDADPPSAPADLELAAAAVELLGSCAATGRRELAAALRTEDGGARVVTPSASVAS